MKEEAITGREAVAIGVHNVLWTGGWDSTYRVLQLAMNGVRVQPYYVIDTRRESSLLELRAMQRIRTATAVLSQAAAERINPSIIVSIHDIPADAGIKNKLRNLRKFGHLGEQYQWLARLVRSHGLPGLELCVHKDDRAHGFIRDDVVRVDRDDGLGYWTLRELPPDSDLTLFTGFRFPLLDMTKARMWQAASDEGYGHVLQETWFCHSPINSAPCGICNPCHFAMQEGMATRMPRRARVRHRFRNVYLAGRNVATKTRRCIWWLSDRIPR